MGTFSGGSSPPVRDNHAWDAMFGSGWRVDLQYVCATREGVGMGGCGKSVLQHFYEEGRIQPARRIGAEPQYVITWCDYTDEMFRTAARRHYPRLRRIASYIPRMGAKRTTGFTGCGNEGFLSDRS